MKIATGHVTCALHDVRDKPSQWHTEKLVKSFQKYRSSLKQAAVETKLLVMSQRAPTRCACVRGSSLMSKMLRVNERERNAVACAKRRSSDHFKSTPFQLRPEGKREKDKKKKSGTSHSRSQSFRLPTLKCFHNVSPAGRQEPQPAGRFVAVGNLLGNLFPR